MAITPYLKLQKPPFDTIPWDAALNGNMDILDGYISRYMSTPNFVGTWTNSTSYVVGQVTLDSSSGVMYSCAVTHTSAASPTTFAQDRIANPTYWTQIPAPGGGYAPLLSPVFTGDPQAPTPSASDNDTSIATTAFVNSAPSVADNVGRNLLHNSKFNVAQRGLGPFTAYPLYTVDRWLTQGVLDTINVTVGAAADASRTQIGDESVVWILGNTFTGNAGATAYNSISQRISNVRRLGNKTVTISFWANAGAPIKLGVNVLQHFGTGGSPSAAVRALATGASFTLATTWARYSATIPIPSTAGKTLGTNGNDFTALEFFYSAGASSNQIAGNIGVQSGAINLWGVQLEIGSVMTPFENIDPGLDYYNCIRFYCTGQAIALGYANAINIFVGNQVTFPTLMRATPTVAVGTAYGSDTNVQSAIIDSPTPSNARFVVTSNGAGQVICGRYFTASAEL